MIKKKTTKLVTSTGETMPEGVYCRDCALAYDYHEKDVNGEFFMCKCPFFEFSKFLRHDICDNFKPKQHENNA